MNNVEAKIYTMSSDLWVEIDKHYDETGLKPVEFTDECIYADFGLQYTSHITFAYNYKITDEEKFTLFLLRWL